MFIFLIFEYLFKNLDKVILKVFVDLLMLSSSTIFEKFSDSLSLLRTFPCSYTTRIVFLSYLYQFFIFHHYTYRAFTF